MEHEYVNLTLENLSQEHLCCALSAPKHQAGVADKRAWLAQRLPEGHVFRKLDAKGKVFIEYAPLEAAWVPVEGENYLYIYCLWVAGSFKGKGHGKALLEYCIQDAKDKGCAGVCTLSAQKKKPYHSEKKFLTHHGFQTADTAPGGYELLALSFDGTLPRFAHGVKHGGAPEEGVTIYYSPQCPFIRHCLAETEQCCRERQIPFRAAPVNSLEQAKAVPCVFNNWAACCNGTFLTTHLLNQTAFRRWIPEET